MIAGLTVGHAADPVLKSGVTIFLPDAPAVAAVHVSGGAPASHETDLLRPGNLVEKVDAVVLSGGSAFGLAAAEGVMAWLAARGRGFEVAGAHVPIVPAAALFDFANGGDKSPLSAGAGRVYAALAGEACDSAVATPAVGSVGAGCGATTAGLKGGFGAAAETLPDGARVAAFAAVNAFGSVTFGDTPFFRAAPFEKDGEFGGRALPASLPAETSRVLTKGSAGARECTTLAVVATDAALSRSEAQRVAIAAHDGLALSIFPAHTLFDGDAVFALATARRDLGARPHSLVELGAAAAIALARAVAVAVYAAAAAPNDGVPTWRDRAAAFG
jgi:L-aminopeptidase/D-esterase-like protein